MKFWCDEWSELAAGSSGTIERRKRYVSRNVMLLVMGAIETHTHIQERYNAQCTQKRYIYIKENSSQSAERFNMMVFYAEGKECQIACTDQETAAKTNPLKFLHF